LAVTVRGTELIEGFAFDRVFDMESQQKDIFDWGVKGIVEGELHGMWEDMS
jgi:hypothetical protein